MRLEQAIHERELAGSDRVVQRGVSATIGGAQAMAPRESSSCPVARCPPIAAAIGGEGPVRLGAACARVASLGAGRRRVARRAAMSALAPPPVGRIHIHASGEEQVDDRPMCRAHHAHERRPVASDAQSIQAFDRTLLELGAAASDRTEAATAASHEGCGNFQTTEVNAGGAHGEFDTGRDYKPSGKSRSIALQKLFLTSAPSPDALSMFGKICPVTCQAGRDVVRHDVDFPVDRLRLAGLETAEPKVGVQAADDALKELLIRLERGGEDSFSSTLKQPIRPLLGTSGLSGRGFASVRGTPVGHHTWPGT